jgi:membrane associated rhomboid family serine protease
VRAGVSVGNLTQYTQSVIPLRDVIPSRTTPFVTITIIVLNALVFLYQETLPVYLQKQFVLTFALIPADFSWVNVFTSMFMHGGWGHILGNMLYLWIFGDNVEDRMGHGRFIAFYLLCGMAAAFAQTAVNPDSMIPMVGASGAIAGVLGAYLILFPHSRVLTLIPLFIIWEVIEIPAVIVLGVWFVLQLLSGVGSLASADTGGGVAFWAHIAGFVTGMALIPFFKRPERQQVEWWDRA